MSLSFVRRREIDRRRFERGTPLPAPGNRSELSTNRSRSYSSPGSGNNRNLNPALLVADPAADPGKLHTGNQIGICETPPAADTSAPKLAKAAARVPSDTQPQSGTPANPPLGFAPLLVVALAVGVAAWAALYAQDWLATMASDRARLAQLDVRLSALARASAKPLFLGTHSAPPLLVAGQTPSTTDQPLQQKTIAELEQQLTALEQRLEHYAAQLSVSAAEPSRSVATGPAPSTTAPRWVLNIATLSHKKSARNLIASLANNGVKAGFSTVNVDHQTLYRVRIKGFTSQALAEQEAMRLQSILGLGGLWVAQE